MTVLQLIATAGGLETSRKPKTFASCESKTVTR